MKERGLDRGDVRAGHLDLGNNKEVYMGKKAFIFLSTAVFLIILSGLALACGCGGGCGGGCGKGCGSGSGASSCQDAAQVCGGHSASTAGMASPTKALDVGNTICPVMGEKINDQTRVRHEYEGKIYNLCCVGCINEFKKDPRKYVKISEDLTNKKQQ